MDDKSNSSPYSLIVNRAIEIAKQLRFGIDLLEHDLKVIEKNLSIPEKETYIARADMINNRVPKKWDDSDMISFGMYYSNNFFYNVEDCLKDWVSRNKDIRPV